MTEDDFRHLALGFEGAIEAAHMGHPDFRVNGRIFATLGGTGKGRGMVKVPPEEQHNLVHDHPSIFEPVNGAWGKQGSTAVLLKAASQGVVGKALECAWRMATALPPPKSQPKKRK
jgi:hypothetical protein